MSGNTAQLISEAIDKLNPSDFNKTDGKPKIASLEKLLSMPVSLEIRDEAFELYKERKGVE